MHTNILNPQQTLIKATTINPYYFTIFIYLNAYSK